MQNFEQIHTRRLSWTGREGGARQTVSPYDRATDVLKRGFEKSERLLKQLQQSRRRISAKQPESSTVVLKAKSSQFSLAQPSEAT